RLRRLAARAQDRARRLARPDAPGRLPPRARRLLRQQHADAERLRRRVLVDAPGAMDVRVARARVRRTVRDDTRRAQMSARIYAARRRIGRGAARTPGASRATLRRAADGADIRRIVAGPAAPQAESYVASLDGRGQALPPALREHMEPRFGADFGAVRVHT